MSNQDLATKIKAQLKQDSIQSFKSPLRPTMALSGVRRKRDSIRSICWWWRDSGIAARN